MHKESGQLLAIKQVPVDSDLQDIIKEISIMQQCDRLAYPASSLRTHTHILLTLYGCTIFLFTKKKQFKLGLSTVMYKTLKHHFVVTLDGNGYFDTLLIETSSPSLSHPPVSM